VLGFVPTHAPGIRMSGVDVDSERVMAGATEGDVGGGEGITMEVMMI
jgi:hypothetical protein